MNKKTLLFAVIGSLVVALLLISGKIGPIGSQLPAAEAVVPVGEILYLSDSSTNNVGTYLYKVDLDIATLHANLTLLPNGLIPYNQVDALACTPDGTKLYCIDKYGDQAHPGTGKLGYYDITIATWNDTGKMVKYGQAILPGVVLAAFSPGGKLYIASESTDSIYTVDLNTAVATLVGKVVNLANNVLVDVSGADIIFAADGTLYLWANQAKQGAPRGLWLCQLPAVGGIVKAQHLGSGGTGSYFTGLAFRVNGYADLVGSTHEDEIFVISKLDASTINKFMMYKDGNPYNYEYGDMTVGPLQLCTKTIGYWKNHSWNNMVITICGIPIDEQLGKEILENAKGKNFSMFFAQLIAAKLNTNNATGIQVIDQAEAWLCQQGVVQNQTLDWDKNIPKNDKSTASQYWEALDYFNNQYECDDNNQQPPPNNNLY
jgi:hypothetical protein